MPDSFAQFDSLQHYETVLKHIHDGVYTLDPNGQITWVNETAIEAFDIGLDREDLIGSSVSVVLNEEDIQKCIEIIQDCLRDPDRESGRCEITLQTADGRDIPCDLHLALLPFEDGEFQGTIGVVRDISDQKRREQQLEVQNRVLRHNLRNDMNIIVGRATRLAQSVTGELKEDVDVIREVGERLLELSEKVRSISKMHDTSVDDLRPIVVNDRIRSLLDTYRSEYPTVSFKFEDGTDQSIELRVRSEELFDMALTNLIENSIKHNDKNSARVSVTFESEADCCFVRIDDNGPGLPEMEREVLKNGSETDLHHSNGMGLWLVYWCVTELRGELQFGDAPNTGARVTLKLPY